MKPIQRNICLRKWHNKEKQWIRVEEDRKVVCVYAHLLSNLLYLPVSMRSNGFYFAFGTISHP